MEFGGLRISFRVHTFENTYGLDRDAMKVTLPLTARSKYAARNSSGRAAK